MEFEAFEKGLLGEALELVKLASELRLGYEIVRLADESRTKAALRISGREERGIGIDSDLPKPFLPRELEARLGDYHTWSTFNRDWRHIGAGFSHPNDIFRRYSTGEELLLRVVYLLTDEEIADRDAEINKAVLHPNFGWFNTKIASPHFEHLLVYKLGLPKTQGIVTSEDRIRALENPQWRDYAKEFCRLAMEDRRQYLAKNRQTLLEQLADVREGKKIIPTAEPTVNAINGLLNLYLAQMQH